MDTAVINKFKEMHKKYLYADYKISELADYLKLSRRTIERWLKGDTLPKERYLQKINEFLIAKQQ